VLGLAQQDAPPIDPKQYLQALKAIKDQQASLSKNSREKIVQAAQAAAATPAAAVAAWIEAVRVTRFAGTEKENVQFKDWKDKETPLLADKETQAALLLYYRWLVLTMERGLGTPVKTLLPNIIQYTKDAHSESAVMDSVMDKAQKEKNMNPRMPNYRAVRTVVTDDRLQRLHDDILNRDLSANPPVKALGAEDLVKVDDWASVPGDVDAIYETIILPEMRKNHDLRVFEYWDMRIKLQGDAVKNKGTYEQEKFAREDRPDLLWSRALEYLELGMRNKGIAELYQVLRTYPTHPEAKDWMEKLEKVIAPSSTSPESGAASATGTTTPILPGATAPAGALPGSR
jgi:hypothetical protein